MVINKYILYMTYYLDRNVIVITGATNVQV